MKYLFILCFGGAAVSIWNQVYRSFCWFEWVVGGAADELGASGCLAWMANRVKNVDDMGVVKQYVIT